MAVITESTANRFWPGLNPLGRRFELDRRFRANYTEDEVVGVAADARFANLTRIDPAHVYLPPPPPGTFIRCSSEPPQVHGRRWSPSERRWWVRTKTFCPACRFRRWKMAPCVYSALARYCAIYCAALAFLALILAGVGIYDVLAYLVSRRIPEIGIRCALGATPFQILRQTLGDGLRLALFGLAGGMRGAFGVCWALRMTLVLPGSSDFFYGVPFYDPATPSIVAAVALLVAGAAVAGRAWRALRLDPMEALRRE